MTLLPWLRRRRGNRHAWAKLDVDDNGIFWKCDVCGLVTREFGGYYDPLPVYGCSALPIPCTADGSGETAGLLVAGAE